MSRKTNVTGLKSPPNKRIGLGSDDIIPPQPPSNNVFFIT